MSDVLDQLLDVTLDDLEDLPEFKPFPVGGHRAKLTLSTKQIKDHPAVEANFVLISTEELADPNTPEEQLCKEGDTASVAFMLDNEYGQGNLKKMATPIGDHFGLSSLREIIEAAQDLEVVIVTTIRTDKEDATKRYMGISSLSVV